MEPSPSPIRSSLTELMQAGVGQRFDPSLIAARQGLTAAERRRVGRLVRDGDVAWDVPSARYAVQVARARIKMPQLLGPRANRILYSVVALLFLVDGITGLRHHAELGEAIWQLVVAPLFAYLAVTNANSPGEAATALRRNEAFLVDAGADEPAEPELAGPTWTKQVVGMVFVVLVMGAAFAVGLWVADNLRVSALANAVLGGALFGVAFLGVMRVINARKRTGRHYVKVG